MNGIVHAKGGSIIGELPKFNQDNSFSWLFDPNKGMYMWAGNTYNDQTLDKGAVFSVYKDEDIYHLAVRGRVDAESGSIANFKIENNSLISYHNGYLISGMSADSTKGCAFWAGNPLQDIPSTLSEEIIEDLSEAAKMGDNAPFRVEHNGDVYC
jgi:hypothetical protein